VKESAGVAGPAVTERYFRLTSDPLMGAAWGDFDNDGDLDLYVTSTERNYLWRNNGDGTFTDVTDLAGIGDTAIAEGGAIADYDGDGDLDFYIFNHDDRNMLFRNDYADTLGNSWIKLRLNGTISNRYGIGAIVRVFCGDLVQTRQLLSGQHYESQSDLLLHFGLGKHNKIDRIEVRWPSGIVQVLTDIEVNQTITVTEPSQIKH